MTTDEIRQAHFDSLHLKWENEDMIRYGSPTNTRMTLKHHPEHESPLQVTRYRWHEMSVTLRGIL